MDIVVGRIAPIALPENGTQSGLGTLVEGAVLAVRSPRGGRQGRKGGETDERRRHRSPQKADPPGSRVLTLLVTDPSGIPQDVGETSYRVLLRFVKQS